MSDLFKTYTSKLNLKYEVAKINKKNIRALYNEFKEKKVPVGIGKIYDPYLSRIEEIPVIISPNGYARSALIGIPSDYIAHNKGRGFLVTMTEKEFNEILNADKLDYERDLALKKRTVYYGG